MHPLRLLPFLCVFLLSGDPPAPRPSSVSAITGQVRDADGPLAGAVVRFKGDAIAVYTDADGRFTLQRPADGRRVTAWKEGYFIGGARADDTPLIVTLHRLPADDCERYAWVNPAPDPKNKHHCGNCHGTIYREWALSGHARAVSNRRFLNLHDGSDWQGRPNVGWNLRADHPDGVGVCASCHAPTAGFDDDPAKLRGVAAAGVHCDYCHKVAGPTGGPLGLAHGRFGLKLLRPEEGQLFLGSLDDVDRGEDAYSPFYRESRYCASCHEGTVFGVHVYSTYSEWLASPARLRGRQCQSCHMTPTGRMSNIAPGKGGVPREPRTLANHRLFNGSQEEMLRRCLQVTTNAIADNGEVRVDVAIRVEGAGHRVPTGFVDRQIILVVEALDAAEQAFPLQRGETLPAAAGDGLRGKAGRLYAKRLTDFDGHSPVPFWRARPEVQDTRLLPDQVERRSFVFAGEGKSVRVRVLYRRFWQETVQSKGWPDDTLTVVEQVIRVP